jgi:GT2 family glycosyltransferase
LTHPGTEAAPTTDPLQRLTVVVVTHHSAHCVDDMARHLAGFAHVVVVDNASDDGTPERVRQRMPAARVLALPTNLGFGAANNRGLEGVTTPYALLLNPDCTLSPESAAQLVRTADAHPTAAIVAPQLQEHDPQPQLNYGWPRWTWAARGPGATGTACVGYACAAAWLLRTQAIAPQAPWRFDEGFFLYYEDEDLCARVFKARQQVLIEPAATARHANRGSVRGRSVVSAWASEWRRGYHHSRSKVRFMALHIDVREARRVRTLGLWTGGIELALRLLTLQPRLIARSAGRWLGMWHARASLPT